MTQLALIPSTKSIQERFEEFHAANPGVYYDLVRMARQARASGASRIGMGQLFEVLRWQTALTTKSWDTFKLNNSFRSRYVRLIESREPDLAGLFETRELRAS